MGNIKFKITNKGTDIESFKHSIPIYNDYLALADKYNFKAIEKIPIEGEDINLEIDITSGDSVDWTMFKLPANVLAIIKDLEHYQSVKTTLQRLYSKIEYLRFDDKYEMDSLAQEVLDMIGSLNHSEHLDNFMLNKSSWEQRIFHTKNKEVSMLLRLRDKDAQYKKMRGLEDAKKHLLPDIKSLIHFLAEGKLKAKGQ
ncbi:MAG TPA: hypothetical protein VD884_19055 [Ohtaekwangia sp.]|nr:hypothetical protein [Ohtaekwangia sp.]